MEQHTRGASATYVKVLAKMNILIEHIQLINDISINQFNDIFQSDIAWTNYPYS